MNLEFVRIVIDAVIGTLGEINIHAEPRLLGFDSSQPYLQVLAALSNLKVPRDHEIAV
jgi:hypothetical protein